MSSVIVRVNVLAPHKSMNILLLLTPNPIPSSRLYSERSVSEPDGVHMSNDLPPVPYREFVVVQVAVDLYSLVVDSTFVKYSEHCVYFSFHVTIIMHMGSRLSIGYLRFIFVVAIHAQHTVSNDVLIGVLIKRMGIISNPEEFVENPNNS